MPHILWLYILQILQYCAITDAPYNRKRRTLLVILFSHAHLHVIWFIISWMLQKRSNLFYNSPKQVKLKRSSKRQQRHVLCIKDWVENWNELYFQIKAKAKTTVAKIPPKEVCIKFNYKVILIWSLLHKLRMIWFLIICKWHKGLGLAY